MAQGDSPDPRRSGIYRTIRLVAVLDMAMGLALLLLGPWLLGTEDFRYLGLGLTIAGALVFAVFTWLAAQAARR
jgi:hypothetical protein